MHFTYGFHTERSPRISPQGARRGVRRLAMMAAAMMALLLLAGLPCHTQTAEADSIQKELWRVGVYGGAQWFAYTAEMGGLPGVPNCCPEYREGSGNGSAFGISAESLLLSRFSGGLRILFANYSGTLSAEEQELVTAERDTVTATFLHTIEAAQPALAAELSVGYEPISPLKILVGMRADLMLGGTYHQREEILSPATIRFENDLRQRMLYDGDIPSETPIHLAVTAAVRYDIPLNREHTFLLAPEVQVWQGLSDLVEGESWTMRGVRVGLNLYFVSRESKPEPTPLAPARGGSSQFGPPTEPKKNEP